MEGLVCRSRQRPHLGVSSPLATMAVVCQRRVLMPRRGLAACIGGTAVVLAIGGFAGTGAAGAAHVLRHAGAMNFPSRPLNVDLVQTGSQAPTDAQCRAQIGVPCYSPQEIRHAYGVDQLINRGDAGRGQTIVIFDSYGSPTITSDLAS